MWFSLGRRVDERKRSRKGGRKGAWIPLFLYYVFEKLVVEL